MIPTKDKQYYQFCAYGFLKNLRFFDPFLLLFFLSKGFSYLDIGILYAIREIGFVLTEIPSGILADGFGRKKSLSLSYIAYLISFMVFYFGSSFWMIALAMLIFSFGESFRSGTHKALIFAYLEQRGWLKHKTEYYGHTRASSQLGSAISAALAAIIVIMNPNLNTIFLFSVFPYLIGLINISLYPKSLDKTNGDKSLKSLLQTSFQLSRESWAVFRQKQMLKAAFSLSFYSAYFKGIKDFLQVLVLSFSIGAIIVPQFNSEQQNALYIGVAYSLLFLLTSFASRNSERFRMLFSSDKKALNVSLMAGILMGGLAGLMMYSDFKLLAIVLFFGVYIIENVRKPIGISVVVEYSNEKINATILSVASQLQSGIAALIALFIGFMADAYSIGLALILTSFLMLLALPFYWFRK